MRGYTPGDAASLDLKEPRQRRSQASFERIISATEELILMHGSENFTLIDVCKFARVSIGSIYLRFPSKDKLIASVILRGLEALAREERAMLNVLNQATFDLSGFMYGYAEDFAEILRKHAPLLRLSMDRASYDPEISALGKEQANNSAAAFAMGIQAFRNEIFGDRLDVKAAMAYRIIFSALARELGLGTSPEAAHPQNWSAFKRELAAVCLAYLQHAK